MSLGLVGATLGKYEILSEIGQGGMSVVYRARDSQLEREVAIKVMHAFLAEQPEAKARFHREAVAVARLRHPHIIEIYDYSGEQAAQSYIVTELVEGASLASRVSTGTLDPPEAALVVASAVAEALAHAHEQGVIHRDLKPENILIGHDGSLKLTDFGIARMLDNQTLTVTGTLLGSPAYMAPEYIDGAPTDARADIYSFGAMLYQFVTGHLPFEAQSPHALLKRIVAGEYMPPEQRNPRVHAAIARIIRRALAREPAQRYPSARELATAIDIVLQRLGLDAKVELPRVLAGVPPPRELEHTLVPRYVGLGKVELARRQVGRALEDFDRVLSVEPEHHEVRRIVRRLARRAWVGRVARDAVLALVGAAVLTVGISTLLGEPRGLEPPPIAGAETTNGREVLRNVTFVVRGPGDLYVDDVLRAKGAAGTLAWELGPGSHRARLVGGGRDITVPFEVLATRDPAPVRLDVTAPDPRNGANAKPQLPATPPRSKLVQLRIAGGLWVDVRQDDQLVMTGQLSPVKLTLSFGTHKLRFSNPCCEPLELDVMVSDTEPPELEPIDLKPSPARLFIDGAPPGARVEVAGKREGLREGEPVFVPMATRGPVDHLVTVMRGEQLLLKAMARFEPGRERRLEVPTP